MVNAETCDTILKFRELVNVHLANVVALTRSSRAVVAERIRERAPDVPQPPESIRLLQALSCLEGCS